MNTTTLRLGVVEQQVIGMNLVWPFEWTQWVNNYDILPAPVIIWLITTADIAKITIALTEV